ncbi:MAG: amidohydrolase [Planctomycetota bacterium]|nr:MAG: amidohydrolase [Planctomycetota bacterium]
MKVDSHHHFWIYSPEEYGWIREDMDRLRRDYLPADLQTEIRSAGIDAVVSVQARQSEAETDWLLELAQQHDFIRGIVGWAPLRDEDVAQKLERWSHAQHFKGVRHVVQDEPDREFPLGDAFNRGVSILKNYGLVYDILIYHYHLPVAIEFVDRHPEQPFVLDHIAKPEIRRGRFDTAWAGNMRELARRENVTCKFSGVATEVRDAEYDIDLIRPYWETALEAFGPRRLMFGSDWPVCLLRIEYADWVNMVRQLAQGLSDDEQQWLWGKTAQQAYRL